MGKRLLASIITAGTLSLLIVGCTPEPQPEPIASPSSEAAAVETPAPVETTEAPAAAVGTRDNPVPVGEVLAFSAESAFQVGAAGPTEVTPTYSILPLAIQIDWENSNAQATAQGQPAGGPLQPWGNFRISFVAANGTTYDTMDDYSVTIPNQLWDIGDVYEGTDMVNANVPVSVPEAEIAGGAWVIENTSSGARVFVAVQ